MSLALLMRQMLWRDQADRLILELADRAEAEEAAREAVEEEVPDADC